MLEKPPCKPFILHQIFCHFSPTPPKVPPFLYHRQGQEFSEQALQGHSSPACSPSAQLHPGPHPTPRPFMSICSPPRHLTVSLGRALSGTMNSEQLSPSARCAQRGADHPSPDCSPPTPHHEPRLIPGPRGADSALVSRERLAPPGMQGALGKSVGAPRCPVERLRPESNSAPRAPIRGVRPPARRTFALRLALRFAPEKVLHVRHGSSVRGLGLADSSLLYGQDPANTTMS